ncbi:MAG: Rieske 2Fe-2S domain-containing protein [Planctomycetota bacterium]
MEFVKVAKKRDVAPDTPFRVTVGNREVVLFCVDGTFYALPSACPHREGPLHEGLVEGKTITCPYHFSRFDLDTGDVIEEPAATGIEKYQIRVHGDDILVAIPD